MDYLTEQARLREEVVQASKVTLFDISISLQYFNISSVLLFPLYPNVSSVNILHPMSTIQKQHWHRRFSHRTTSLWQTAACRPTRRRSGSFLSLKTIIINIFLINIMIIRLSPRNLMESSSSSKTHLCLPGDIWENMFYNILYICASQVLLTHHFSILKAHIWDM